MRTTTTCLLPVVLVTVAVARVAGAEEATVAQVLARLASSPTIDEVQEAALRVAALEPERARSLVRRVRWVGLLPELELTLDRGLERDGDLDRAYGEMDQLSVTTDDDLDFGVAVHWDLGQLVFVEAELRASREAADQASRRRELLLAVTRAYYELVLVHAQNLLVPAEGPSEQLERALRAAELEAVLDSLTGGLYSRSRQGSTSER